ncbi:MAG: hypothetical protein J6W13_05060 [Salinivirgaceae bacterium]|nr:hypothetical protein [Salinivirgaceae bacterium]
MKKNDDWTLKLAKRRGFAVPFIIFFVGLFNIIKSYQNIGDTKNEAKGEIIYISIDTTTIKIKGEEQSFYLNSRIDKSKIQNGDYAEILYSIVQLDDHSQKCITQLIINKNMIFKYSWWNYNRFSVWLCLIGLFIIPFMIKQRNEEVRKGEFDSAGPIIRTLVKVYPEDNDSEPTDIDYKEQSSIINEENLVYYGDMDYSVYKTDEKEIISVVFSDENGAYCRYFTLPEIEGKDYSQLAELANDIRNNAENYAEIEIDA